MNINIQMKDLLMVLISSLIFFTAPVYSTVLSAGEDHTCMLKSNGVAYCWGDNSVGQLGNGSTEASLTPVKVSGGLSVRLHKCWMGSYLRRYRR